MDRPTDTSDAKRRLRASLASPVAMALATLLIASAALAQIPMEKSTVRVLPLPGPHWVYLLDPITNSMEARVTIVNGDTLDFEGMLNGGYVSVMAVAPDHKSLYLADTYYSRGTRGDRTDVVSIFDSTTLKPTGEVVLPPKRLLSNSKRYSIGVTPDGRFMLVANMTPATSTSVVDLNAKKMLGEIDTPGCTQVLVSGNRKFTAMCADGSLLTVRFGDDGKATAKNRAKPFFNVDQDPVFDQPVMIGDIVYFVSYHGMIYPVDLSGDTAKPGDSWLMLTSQDKAAHWLPGGWELEAVDAHRGLLYVLMHQGTDWSHEQSGSEIWIYDLARKTRVGRIVLPEVADSIYVTPDDKPLLFAASHDGTLQAFDAVAKTYRGMMSNLGSPWLIYGVPQPAAPAPSTAAAGH
ncbi:MAG TPA: amine dehydrogenase large subunit [Candidatus Binataceae bacterium]|nr:amine dehydrogenase large subunit [Candidatus Binataceae bacterium]